MNNLTPTNVSASQATNDETSVRPDILAPVPEDTQETVAFAEEDIVTTHERQPPSWGALWESAMTQPPQNLGTVLQRSYQIANLTWAPAAHFTNLLEIDLAKVLCAIPQIKDKLKFYKYFRFKAIQIKVRIQATGWHYGALALSHVPGNSHNVHRTVDIQALMNDPVLISAASADDVDYIMPWSIPLLWGDLDNEGIIVEENIVRFYVDSIIPLSMIGTTVKNAEIVVFANFVDPEVTYPRTYVPAPLAATKKESSLFPTKRVQGQSKVVTKEADEKSEKSSYHSDSSDFTSAVLEVANFVKEVAPIAMEIGAMLDKPSTTSATTIMQNYVARDMVYGEGLDNALKLSLYPSASVTTDGNHNGGDDGNPKLLALQMTPSYFMHTSWTDTALAGSKVDDWNVAPVNVKGTPVAGFVPTFLEWFTDPFYFWRGSIRFSFYCYTSTFITSRVRFVHFPPGVTAPAVLDPSTTGDFYTRVYDITGDTLINFTVPWQMKEMWLKRNNTLGTMALYITNLMTSVDSAIPPTVHMLGFVSAAEDYQVGFFGDDAFSGDKLAVGAAPAARVVEAQSSVWTRAAEDEFVPFPETSKFTRTQHVAHPEEYCDMVTLMKRYTKYADVTGVAGLAQVPINIVPVTNQLSLNSIQYFTACHVYMRGGRRYKVYPVQNTTGANIVTRTQYRRGPAYVPGDAFHRAPPSWIRESNVSTNNSLTEVEIPYYSGIPYENVNGYNYSVYAPFNEGTFQVYTTSRVARTSEVLDVYIAVADDFQVGYLCSPPALEKEAVP